MQIQQLQKNNKKLKNISKMRKFVGFFECFDGNTQDPTFSDMHFARNKNNTTRQPKPDCRIFVKPAQYAVSGRSRIWEFGWSEPARVLFPPVRFAD